jgi:hypothetical protein
MNKLPYLPNNGQITRSIQHSFGGYQHTEGSYDGTIYDMTNMSSREYPLLSTREKRVIVKEAVNFNGCIAVDDILCYVDGEDLYKGNDMVATVSDEGKTFTVLGNRVLIFPDKRYLNLAAKGRYATSEDLSAAVTAPIYGDVYAVGETLPYALYVWNGTEWTFYENETGTMTPSYSGNVIFKANGFLYGEEAVNNCIYAPDINWNDYFRAGDAVNVSGCVIHTSNNKMPVIREIDGNSLYFYECIFTVDTVWRYIAEETVVAGSYGFSVDETSYCFTLAEALSEGDTLTWDQIELKVNRDGIETVISVTEGTAENEFTLAKTEIDYEEAGVTIKREVPDMDYLCTANNRLWGCKGDTIYASKLGDPFNFNVFDGLSTDSYSVETGSPGEFTACYNYLGYPTFFKEDAIFKIYGSKPSNFEAISSLTAGVAKNCAKSLAVAGDMLFYLSPAGMVCYSGGTPMPIKSVFGNVCYRNGVGGSDGIKYYISMMDEEGISHLFVYDTTNGLWHKEDDLKILDFYRYGSQLLMVDENCVFMKVYGNGDSGEGLEETFLPWSVEFGDFIENSPDKKTLTKIQIQLALAKDASAEMYIQYDGGNYLKVGPTLMGKQRRSWYLPLIPKRCDYFRIKLTGEGGCRIHSLVVEYSTGSAL